MVKLVDVELMPDKPSTSVEDNWKDGDDKQQSTDCHEEGRDRPMWRLARVGCILLAASTDVDAASTARKEPCSKPWRSYE